MLDQLVVNCVTINRKGCVVMRISKITEGILVEGGLSRVLHHTSGSFAVLTAFRGEFSLAASARPHGRAKEKIDKCVRSAAKPHIGNSLANSAALPPVRANRSEE